MYSLAVIATFFATATGSPCAVIDNSTNTAAFAVPGQPTITRTYTDYGDNLGYSGRVPKAAWRATRAAEAKLRVGKPGPKRKAACA